MPLSVDELRGKVDAFRNKGLNTQQIADELSLSPSSGSLRAESPQRTALPTSR